jgi:hypothetical protein
MTPAERVAARLRERLPGHTEFVVAPFWVSAWAPRTKLLGRARLSDSIRDWTTPGGARSTTWVTGRGWPERLADDLADAILREQT